MELNYLLNLRYAHDTLTAFMASHGFNVTPRYKGLETAWKAEAQVLKGGRTLGVNSEMDALPGIGHALVHLPQIPSKENDH